MEANSRGMVFLLWYASFGARQQMDYTIDIRRKDKLSALCSGEGLITAASYIIISSESCYQTSVLGGLYDGQSYAGE